MGKARARTEAELTARKQEILAAAEQQLMTQEYETITLATIAEQISISRPQLYHYYKRKQDIFIDLMVREYRQLAKELTPLLEASLTREQFCRALTDHLLQHECLLKLLSLQLPIWHKEYDDQILCRFVAEAQSYQATMHALLACQFPDASPEARSMFFLQLSVYCNALYEVMHLPQSMIEAMQEAQTFISIPGPEEICFDVLMKLTAGLI